MTRALARGVARFWGVIPVALIGALLLVRAFLATPPLDNLARIDAPDAPDAPHAPDVPGVRAPRDPAGTTVYTGSLWIARGGPVIVGFQSPGDARLVVGPRAMHGTSGRASPDASRTAGTGATGPGVTGPGVTGPGVTGPGVTGTNVTGTGVTGSDVTRTGVTGTGVTGTGVTGTGVTGGKDLIGRGVVKDRLILPAGPVAIRFAAPPGARLVWSPVGRRGDPEYVPASSLSPEPPERAQFGRWVGAAPLDGAIAAGLLLVILGTCFALARRRLREVGRTTWLAIGVVFAVGCIVRWIDLGGFGATWDEDVNWAAGRNYVTNILSLDLSPASWMWNFEHPPVMKYLAGIGAQFADGYGPARALSAVWMAAGCALLVPIGARLYSLRVGIFAAAIATLLPHLVAHGQIVGHEAPTVLWWTLGILLALTTFDGDPPPRQLRWRLAAVGVVIGVAVASRFVNGLLGVVCLAIVVERAGERRLRVGAEAAIIMPLAAFTTFYVLWPRLWFGPVAALRASLDKLGKLHALEPFLGEITNTPGRHYFLVYLAITLPITILAGVMGWLVRSSRERNSGALIVLLWFVVPLAVMFSPVRQDGVRYVMPCVLALAVMSAAGWDYLTSLLAARSPRLRHAFAGWMALVVLYLGVTLVRFHPYYLDYYSELVGGPAQVQRRGFAETAWWGEGLEEAVDHVNRHAAPGARVFRNCIEPQHLAWFREDLWAPMTNSLRQAEWIVAYSPHIKRCPIPPEFERAHVVEVQGAILAIVYRLGGAR